MHTVNNKTRSLTRRQSRDSNNNIYPRSAKERFRNKWSVNDAQPLIYDDVPLTDFGLICLEFYKLRNHIMTFFVYTFFFLKKLS